MGLVYVWKGIMVENSQGEKGDGNFFFEKFFKVVGRE